MESKERIMELLRGIAGDNCFGSIEKIAEYLIENGVVAPPRKVGDTVWTNFSVHGSYLRKTDRPYECKVLFVGLNESACGGYINFEYVKSGYQFPMDFDQIGKTVFLTREAALKAGEPQQIYCQITTSARSKQPLMLGWKRT